jgi:hypothetical protein
VAPRRLKVFGDEAKFRDVLRRRLKVGQELLDHLASVRAQIKPARPGESGLERALARYSIGLEEVNQGYLRFIRDNHRAIRKYLGPEADNFAKAKAKRRTGLETPEEDADYLEARINYERAELRRVLDRVPPPGPSTVRPPEDRFAELRRSGLIQEAVLNSYVRRMSRTRTKAQISDAIGAAKELLEATMCGALELLSVPYPNDDFGRLGKILRQEMTKLEPGVPTTKAADALKQLASGFVTTELALATLRNDLGSGHGRVRYPPELKSRHAQLAIDVADTNARYVVATLTDLKIL